MYDPLQITIGLDNYYNDLKMVPATLNVFIFCKLYRETFSHFLCNFKTQRLIFFFNGLHRLCENKEM